jgi:hypothetical protein
MKISTDEKVDCRISGFRSDKDCPATRAFWSILLFTTSPILYCLTELDGVCHFLIANLAIGIQRQVQAIKASWQGLVLESRVQSIDQYSQVGVQI